MKTSLDRSMGPGLYNMDCMEAMKQFPDGFFDLAIVDPPYGGGAAGTPVNGMLSGGEFGMARQWPRTLGAAV